MSSKFKKYKKSLKLRGCLEKRKSCGINDPNTQYFHVGSSTFYNTLCLGEKLFLSSLRHHFIRGVFSYIRTHIPKNTCYITDFLNHILL